MKKAERLLERARQSKIGWRHRELHSLLDAFGFEYRESGDRVYFHRLNPALKPLRISWHPGREVLPVYVRNAVKKVEELLALQANPGQTSQGDR